jgi:hypothetical protein
MANEFRKFQGWVAPTNPDDEVMGGATGGPFGAPYESPVPAILPTGAIPGATGGPSTAMTLGGKPIGGANISSQSGIKDTSPTDWGGIAGAGIGAAGQTVGTIAQLAGQKAAMDSAMAQNSAGRMLTEKLAKMQLAQQAGQFDASQKLRGLMWALGANKAAIGTSGGGRDLRRQDEQMMSDVLARLYMR